MAIEYNRDLLHAVLDATLDAALVSDDQGRCIDANTSACALFGLRREELLGCKTSALKADDERALLVKETPNIVPGVHLTVLRDVTEQRREEAELRNSQAVLESVESLAHVGSWVNDPGGRGSRSAEHARIVGLPPDGPCTTEDYLRCVHPDDRDAVRSKFADATARRATYINEYRVVRPTGEVRWVHSRALAQPGRVVGIIQDVTERHVLIEGFRASEQRYRRLIDSMSDGLLLFMPDGAITLANKQMATILGTSVDELVGESLFRFVPDEDHETARARLERRKQGIAEQYVAPLKRKDGSTVWVSAKVDPMLDANGKLEGTVGVYHDLSERQAVEEMRGRLIDAEEQLRHSQKMEAIGVLAGGVAHDFNNLLSVIMSYAEVLREELIDEERRGEVDEIRRAAERAATLTRQLLAFSRKQMLAPRDVDMKDALHGMEKMLRRLLGEDVALAIHTADTGGVVFADPGQVEQVVMNLVVNARDAMPRGGSLTIDVAEVQLTSAEVPAGVSPGAYVRVAVTDTGIGMDAATRSRIFEPFFTTKNVGEGTGLGLSTVFGIVAQSGGYITVDSEPGRGTTFHIYLPGAVGARRQVAETRQSVNVDGTETILLVEDDDGVRRAVEKVLRRRGYKVLQACNAGEALLLSEKHDAPIDLLLTDLVMPLMSGRELAERIVKQRPEVKVLFMTGYTTDAMLRHGLAEGTVALLHKPVSTDTLARKVRDVLDASVHAAE